MHISDGFLDISTSAVTVGLAVAGLAVALREVRRSLPPRKMPLLGLAAAFIFAAQMLNFPVVAGSSGHLTGGTLAAILLGPAPAVVVMSSVIILQCFLFADGGVTALGANVFNMAVIAPCVGFAVFRSLYWLLGKGRRRVLAATAVAAWAATVVTAGFCALELAFSGTADVGMVVPAMLGIHALIGIAEAVITALVVGAVLASGERAWQPDLSASLESKTAFSFALLTSFALAVLVAPFACSWPDGLESVAERLGFIVHAAEKPALAAPLADYTVPGVGCTGVSIVLAGVLGTAVAFLLVWALVRWVRKPTPPAANP
jgi:cobalt/nickel transport system permease protein